MRQKRRLFGFVSVAVVGIFLLAACGNTGQENTAVLPQVPAAEQNEDIAELRANVSQVAGNLPTDFTISIYQGAGLQAGDEVLFSELLADGKPVVLNFWAGLCPPCRVEMPDLQAVSDAYQGQVLLFGLDVGPFTGLGSNEDGRKLLNELAITYPAGTTADPNVVREYGILGMPTTYFITPDGEIHDTWTGLLTEEKLSELVEDLLAASNS
ncbi:MAG TPA: TlpA family protein disulfide reductase [Anaerolineae bacterium]|nr:TlpA family protein disulfide reductase [Anaerolineae bacterium]HIP72083.1 TlpA family protein disulfide reductase [Anaerolineae bacterium]